MSSEKKDNFKNNVSEKGLHLKLSFKLNLTNQDTMPSTYRTRYCSQNVPIGALSPLRL